MGKEYWFHVYPNYERYCYSNKSMADFYNDIVWMHGAGCKPIYRIHVKLK